MKPGPSLAADAPAAQGPQAQQPPSKTQRKREMTALQRLGEDLLALNDTQLAGLGLPERLLDALRDATRITAHEGRRRQMQYVGRLMRQVDPEPIRRALADATGASAAAVALMHRCERLRDRLLDDDTALTEFLSAHPQVDAQHLRATIRAARRERAAQAAPKHARELYRWLHRTLQDKAAAT
jgi:ribosome-associated protein